jgi:hypothetical protein
MARGVASQIKGPGLFGQGSRLEYRLLVRGQPIVLQREPSNEHDPNAVVAMTVMLQRCGYIARQQAAIIAPDLDAGVLWLCKVTRAANAMHCPEVLLWRSRGLPQNFKQMLLSAGASEAVAEGIIQGRYIKEAA